jgi:DNA-binding winged helix-turn-helix (wHTH) protein/TolB-like protein
MLIRRSGTQVIGERQAASLPGEIELARAAEFDLGSLQVQPSLLQLSIGDESRTIEPRVMQVLVLLAGERGNVVSRDQLIDSCWGGRIVGEDAINRCIAKVRRIGAESGSFEIETVPRVGYRLNPAGAGQSARPALWPLRRSIVGAMAAVLILALVGTGFWYARNSGPPQPTVAVIPFVALNSDPDANNFAQSITDTVSNALAQTGARLPDNIHSAEDARRSGASLIVSGTVRRQGSTYLVTARVGSSASGSTILSNEFQANGSDAAAALAGQVAIWLVPPVRMWASFLPVERDTAVTDGIMHVFLTREGGDNLRAWELSRTLAKAHSGSGSAQLVFALLTSDVFPQIAREQRRAAVASARLAAEKAARLLPKASRPLAVRDCHLTAPGWHVLTERCDEATRRAIADDPDVPLLPYLFGAQLVDTGRFQEASKMVDMDLAADNESRSGDDGAIGARCNDLPHLPKSVGECSSIASGRFEELLDIHHSPDVTDAVSSALNSALQSGLPRCRTQVQVGEGDPFASRSHAWIFRLRDRCG